MFNNAIAPLAGNEYVDSYHQLLHWILQKVGHHVGDDAPGWLHPVLHIVLIWAPLALLAYMSYLALRMLRRRIHTRRERSRQIVRPSVPGFPTAVIKFVLRFSKRDQLFLVAVGILAMPVLYASLELPKIIINNAIDSDHFPVSVLGSSLGQIGYLLALSGLYLLTILVNGGLKFGINVYKGAVGERLLRRLRLMIYRRWHRGAGPKRRAEVIPLIAQEVEPIGGFASDAFALPVFQGGTFITILIFMFMQDPVLGAAAMTLLPVQLALIPRLQRRVNLLARARVAEVRALGGELGDQASADMNEGSAIVTIGASLKRIEQIRRQIHRSKFFIKSLNNFLTALTPFFFYSIGGYLVIEGRLTLGALVAVLAAYKDFSAPLRELFRYYQTTEDVRIRYEEMLRFLATENDIARFQTQRPEISLSATAAVQREPDMKLANAEVP